MRQVLSFFLTITMGDAHGDVEGRAMSEFTSFYFTLEGD